MTAPSICVGLLGPKRAGKSTLLQALLDNENDPTSQPTVATTLKLRFAHTEIYKCSDSGSSSTATNAPCQYRSFGSMLFDAEVGYAAALDDGRLEAEGDETLSASRRVSFVDCPGHMGFVPTMLKGIMMSDVVLILSRPKAGACFSDPPTLEVLATADLMGKSIVVVQSRKDTASGKLLENHRAQIRRFTHDIIRKEVPIVEVSAQDMSSIGGVCRHIMDSTVLVKKEEGGMHAPALMLIGASCVVDPVAAEEVEAAGAAAAGDATMFVTIYGRLVQGVVSAADEVEVRPGVTVLGDDGKLVCHPIILKVTSVMQQQPAAGGGMLLALRATATVAVEKNGMQQQQVWSVLGGDGGLEGHVLGHAASLLPGVYVALKMKFCLVRKMLDPYDEEGKVKRVKDVEVNQELLLIIGTMSAYGRVRKIEEVEEDEEVGANDTTSGSSSSSSSKRSKKKMANKKRTMVMVVGGLTPPTCARAGENILICRRLVQAWHLIGRGEIMAGVAIPVCYDRY